MNAVLFEALTGQPSTGLSFVLYDKTSHSLPILSNDGVKVVTAGVFLQLGNGDGSGRSGLNTSVGDGPCEPRDDVV